MTTQLSFRADGTFRIVQITDLHWQNNDPEDRQSRLLMDRIIEEEQPDLVVFTGDMIHCELARDRRAAFRQAVAAAADQRLPWAFVFGNHDAEEGITREEMTALARELPGCVVPPEQEPCGIGNYTLPIARRNSHDRSRSSSSAAAVLYLLDSGSYAPASVGAAAWIKREQIDWYIGQSRRYEAANGGKPLPALAFFHIPLPEFQEMWDFRTCYGYNFEGVGCSRINSGMFAAMIERGDIAGVFVGHDHVNDYWGTHHGIRLCYGRATGFNAYGHADMPRGARVIELFEDGRPFRTWLRLEDGLRMDAQPVHHSVFEEVSVQIRKRLAR
ncbi:metallophosphoesterase family protein [Paenibacillus kobensis]|uniref:metallophosphoesterase family protein n=1 Tax=Paenibacillus kobensis TaxID=59841 RepID=UPI000FD7F820|nr:metallophosphoesterase family protein [Paenibacillus kobensis]